MEAEASTSVPFLGTPAEARSALLSAVTILSARGLAVAARWAAELLTSVRHEPDADQSAMDVSLCDKAKLPEPAWAPDDDQETKPDQYLLGKSYFDVKDFQRASSSLGACTGSKGRFLWRYARFLLSDKRAAEASGVILGPKYKPKNPSPEALALLQELQDAQDPFELYLKAVLLSRAAYRLEAIDALVRSVCLYQYNWSAWKLLEILVEGIDELRVIVGRIPQDGFMSRFFLVHATLEAHNASEMLEPTLQSLDELFPSSLHLRTQRALISYHLRDFDTCEVLFDSIFAMDPHRVEDVDVYSNILYVMGKKAKLTALAQRFATSGSSGGSERMRPEVCCLLGNYWSLKGEHENAIGEFRRALKLDSGYLSAWTLMGHEYVELKNTHAAIESYRRAIDCNSKDYRAWYGLGQTYEMLDMPFYSLHYYQRATALRPYDSRMWLALAATYEKLNRRAEAIKATKRALLNAGVDDHAVLVGLAKMLDAEGQKAEAVKYHRRIVEQAISDDGRPTPRLAPSLIYMAEYELRNHKTEGGDLRAAREYLDEVVRLNVDEKDDAKRLLRQLASMEVDASAAPGS